MSGHYQDLKVWSKSMELTVPGYRLTQCFPDRELYGLTNQMRRAAVSIPSNIAEGKGKSSDREFTLFLCHARGSLHELETQFLIAQDLGYLNKQAGEALAIRIAETGKMLNGLVNSLKEKPTESRSKVRNEISAVASD